MSTCPHCGTTVPNGAVYCGNCGAALNSQTTTPVSKQPLMSSQTSRNWSKSAVSGDLQTRYEKAMKRAEQLSYAVAGLGIVILVVLLVLSFA